MIVASMASPAWAVLLKGADWQMDETSGQMIDSSGNNNNGTPTNVDQTGSRYVFNGTNSYVAVPDRDSLDPKGKDIKLKARVKVTDRPMDDDSYDIVRKGLVTTPGGDYKMEIKRAADPTVGKLHCLFKGDGGTVDIVAQRDIVDGNGHKLECIKTGTTVVARIDGEIGGTTAGSAGSISNASNVIVGAKTANPLDDMFDGSMDFVSIDIAQTTPGTTGATTSTTTTTGTTGTTTGTTGTSCQNPQRVLQDVTETGASTNTFTTTTNAFRVNYDGRGFDVVPNSTARIRIIDNVTQDIVIFVPLDADTADSFIANAPPGTYELVVDVDPESAERGPTYIVSVEDCRGTTTGTTGTTTGTTNTTGTTGTSPTASPTASPTTTGATTG